LWMMISYISWKFMLLCSMHQVGASESARASYRNCKETYGTKAISYLYSCIGNSPGSDLSHLKISAFLVLAFILPVSVQQIFLGGWIFSALPSSSSRMEISCEEEGDVKICLKVYDMI
jgi:hypothetical protein